jgi:expansin (peptidoglycan-binding protein)
MRKLWLTLSFIFSLFLSCGLGQFSAMTSCSNATITYYQGINQGACSFGTIPPPYQIAALSQDFYNNGTQCGSCFELNGPLGSVVVMATDECPAAGNLRWCASSAVHFDMSQEAFQQIQTVSAGWADITWQHVSCPSVLVSGNVQYAVKDGSNPYWFGVQLRNHVVQITALYVSEGNAGNWVSLNRTDYNYWICSSCFNGAATTPISLRLVGETGQQLDDLNVINNISTPIVITFAGNVQFSAPSSSLPLCSAGQQSTQQQSTQSQQQSTQSQQTTQQQFTTQFQQTTQEQSTQSQNQQVGEPISSPTKQNIGVIVGPIVAILIIAIVAAAIIAFLIYRRRSRPRTYETQTSSIDLLKPSSPSQLSPVSSPMVTRPISPPSSPSPPVSSSNLRAVPPKPIPPRPNQQFTIGSVVQVLYSDGKYYSASIVDISGDQYLIKYLEYNQQEWKPKSALRI